MPDIRTFLSANRPGFTASCISSIKPKKISSRPGSTPPAAWNHVQRSDALQAQGRYEDAIRVLSDAVTGIKGQSPALPSRRRSLAILYQQLGQLYRDTQNYQASIFTFEELGPSRRGRGSSARMMIMDNLPRRKRICLKRCRPARKRWRNTRPILDSNESGPVARENGQTDDAVKMLKAQCMAMPETANLSERRHRCMNAGGTTGKPRNRRHAAEVLPGPGA